LDSPGLGTQQRADHANSPARSQSTGCQVVTRYSARITYRVSCIACHVSRLRALRAFRVSRLSFLVSRLAFGVWRLAFGAGLQPGRAKIYLSRSALRAGCGFSSLVSRLSWETSRRFGLNDQRSAFAPFARCYVGHVSNCNPTVFGTAFQGRKRLGRVAGSPYRRNHIAGAGCSAGTDDVSDVVRGRGPKSEAVPSMACH
jgi:hypothetical protein